MGDRAAVLVPRKCDTDSIHTDERYAMRSGPKTLDDAVKATEVIYQDDDYLVISKPPDVRMDGNFKVTGITFGY